MSLYQGYGFSFGKSGQASRPKPVTFPCQARKKGPASGPLFKDVKELKSDSAGPTADLTQKVGRQFDYWLLVVSFDAVVRQFKYLLHCSPREGLDKNEEPVLSA